MAVEFRGNVSAEQLAEIVNKCAAERLKDRPIDAARRAHHIKQQYMNFEQNGRLEYGDSYKNRIYVHKMHGTIIIDFQDGSSLEQDKKMAEAIGSYLKTDIRVRR